MQAPFDNIVQHLFHQPSLHSVTVDELEQMAVQHPYFAAAHFLLLKKMQDTAHPQFTKQLHKTAIYFNNPLWLQFLLQPETVADFTVSAESPFITSEPAKQTPADEGYLNGELHNGTDETSSKQYQAYEPTAADSRETAAHAEVLNHDHPAASAERGGMMDLISEVFSDANPLYSATPEPVAGTPELHAPAATTEAATAELPQETADNASTILPADAPWPADAAMGDAGMPDGDDVAGELTVVGDYSNEEVQDFNRQQEADQKETPPANNIEEIATGKQYNEEQAVAPAPEAEETPVEQLPSTVMDDPERGIENTPDAAEAEIRERTAETADHDDTDEVKTGEPGSDGSADHMAAELPKPETAGEVNPFFKTVIETTAAKTDVLFEPYHTVDYFASQGIKLTKQEADGKDKLGRQLKSFTDWLKTMKKLPQVSIDKILAENEESKVVEDASHSLDNKEVVTEAMAEVFEKQGLHQKAAEIYRKLSLLNPAKSAYFAARIDALKQ